MRYDSAAVIAAMVRGVVALFVVAAAANADVIDVNSARRNAGYILNLAGAAPGSDGFVWIGPGTLERTGSASRAPSATGSGQVYASFGHTSIVPEGRPWHFSAAGSADTLAHAGSASLARAGSGTLIAVDFFLAEPAGYSLEALTRVEFASWGGAGPLHSSESAVSLTHRGPGGEQVIGRARLDGAAGVRRLDLNGELAPGYYSLSASAASSISTREADTGAAITASFWLSLELSPVPAPGPGSLALIAAVLLGRRARR